MNLAEQARSQKPLCTPRDEKACLCGLGSGVEVDEEQVGEGEPGPPPVPVPFLPGFNQAITTGEALRWKASWLGALPHLILVFLFGFSF